MSYRLNQLGWPQAQPTKPEPQPEPQQPEPTLAGSLPASQPETHTKVVIPDWLVALTIGCALITPLLLLTALWQISHLRSSITLMAHMGYAPQHRPYQ